MIRYINSIEDVIDIHKKTIAISGGGKDGVRDLSSLESAIEFIKDDELYPDFVAKLTHLFFVANKSHCFFDGNKRVAISLGLKFLLDNGFLFACERFIHKMEIISLHLAAGRIDKALLFEIINSIIAEEDYSEDLKIKIMNAISVE